MRFIRQEHIITKICDKIVNDNKTILNILNNLFSKSIEFSLSVRQVNFSGDVSLNYPKCRIKKINEDTVDFLVIKTSSFMIIKNIEFGEIAEIKAITKKNEILKTCPDVNMWDFVEIDEKNG